MKILLNKDIDLNKWEQLLNKAKQTSPFQTPEYFNYFNSFKNFSASVHAIEQNNSIQALCLVTLQKENGIKGYFSRRAIIYGGPLINTNEPESLLLLLKSIKLYYKRKAIYIETRNYFDYSSLDEMFHKANFIYAPWMNFQVNTSNIDTVKAEMSNSRLRQIKKAIKNGAKWHEAKNIDEIKTFYSILENLYTTKIKKPLLSEDFFIDFFKKKLGKFLLIYKNDTVIGGIMCPIYLNKTIYEFYICGLDNEYKEQYPSVMATWAAIEYANQNNIPIFDFMGAGQPNKDYGVRDFKARFGGNKVEYGRYIYILNSFLYSLGKLVLKIIKAVK